MKYMIQNVNIDCEKVKFNIYAYICLYIMCPPGYHHNGFVATHALGHMIYGLHIAGTNEPKNAQQAKQGAQYKWS